MNNIPYYQNFTYNPPNMQAYMKSNIQNSLDQCKTNENKTNTELKTCPKKKFYTRTRFSPQEDDEIIRLVSIYGENNWNKISRELYAQNKFQRTPKQCKDRYINYLSPDIQNKEWTIEEDQSLILNFCINPYRWQLLKKYLPGRSEIAIKNRFKHIQKDGMKFLRTLYDQTQEKQMSNSNNSIYQMLPKIEKVLNQSNPHRANHIKSIINNSMEVYQTCFQKCNKQSKNSEKEINNEISNQEISTNEFMPLNSESDYFDLFDYL